MPWICFCDSRVRQSLGTDLPPLSSPLGWLHFFCLNACGTLSPTLELTLFTRIYFRKNFLYPHFPGMWWGLSSSRSSASFMSGAAPSTTSLNILRCFVGSRSTSETPTDGVLDLHCLSFPLRTLFLSSFISSLCLYSMWKSASQWKMWSVGFDSR